uniref:Syndecan n=1 Tax=Corethrella appendiculata TaxID=1370023 RepID=U5EN73_9DIPT
MFYKRIYISITLLAYLMLVLSTSTSYALDEKKTNIKENSHSSLTNSEGSNLKDEIYIDDEGLEGSGGRGEIHDDLEKEDDESSGSGYGIDDEDSLQPNHKTHNINKDKTKGPDVDSGSGDDHDDDIDDDEDDLYTETNKPIVDPTTTDDEDIVPKKDTGYTHEEKEIDLDVDQTQHGIPTDRSGHDTNQFNNNEVLIMNTKNEDRTTSFFAQPGILAAVIGGAVVGLLCAILVVMFIVYRMRKKDEGSYALDEPKRSPTANSYAKNANNREFYA